MKVNIQYIAILLGIITLGVAGYMVYQGHAKSNNVIIQRLAKSALYHKKLPPELTGGVGRSGPGLLGPGVGSPGTHL